MTLLRSGFKTEDRAHEEDQDLSSHTRSRSITKHMEGYHLVPHYQSQTPMDWSDTKVELTVRSRVMRVQSYPAEVMFL